jgi:CubicO group peptidase (beta-lactamase class C family)
VVVKDGQVVLAKGYGKADPGSGAPIDPATTELRIGSTTKVITATAIAQLLEQGRIRSLDDPANLYLKRVKLPDWDGRQITVWDLLTHRAGFEDHAFGLGAHRAIARPVDAAQIRRAIPKLVRRPGSVSVYSNVSTALLGIMVEDVSGESIQDYFARHIFQPLGMGHSYLNYALTSPRGLAVPYAFFPDGSKQRSIYTPMNPFIAPAGGVNTTGLDMARFMAAHMAGENGQGSILSPATFRLMHARHVANHPATTGFGMIFIEGPWNGVHVVEHGGGWPGFQTVMLMVPDRRLGVFVSIIGDPPMAGLGEQLRSLVGPTRLKPDAAIASEPLLSSAYVRDSVLAHFLGDYRPAAAPVTAPASAFAGTYCRQRRSYTTLEAVFDLLSAPYAVWRVAPGADASLTIRGVSGYRQVAPGVFWKAGAGPQRIGDPNASALYAFSPGAKAVAPLLSVDAWTRCDPNWNPVVIGRLLPLLLLAMLAGVWCLFWRGEGRWERRARWLPVAQLGLLIAMPLILMAGYGEADGLMYRVLMGRPGRFVALAVAGDLAALAALATVVSALAAWRLGWWGEGARGAVRRAWFTLIAAASALLLAVLWSLNLIGAHLP